MSRVVQKIFAIKTRNRRKTEQMQKFFGPQFLWGAAPTLRQFVRATYYPLLVKPITCQSLVEFRLLISVCEAWQGSRMQNLQRVAKMQVEFYAVCGPKFMTFWDDVGDPW